MRRLGKHYKTRDLAELLGISTATLLRARDEGHLRVAGRIGRDLLWAEDDVLAWLDSTVVSQHGRVVSLQNRRDHHQQRRAG